MVHIYSMLSLGRFLEKAINLTRLSFVWQYIMVLGIFARSVSVASREASLPRFLCRSNDAFQQSNHFNTF